MRGAYELAFPLWASSEHVATRGANEVAPYSVQNIGTLERARLRGSMSYRYVWRRI
jgi:hypothetical protein